MDGSIVPNLKFYFRLKKIMKQLSHDNRYQSSDSNRKQYVYKSEGFRLSQFTSSPGHTERYLFCVINALSISAAAQSKAWTVFARSNAGVAGSNPTRGMDVCVHLFCVSFVLYVGRGLATNWSPSQRFLVTVYRIKKLKKRPKPNKGL
jgi:hypothetical protein